MYNKLGRVILLLLLTGCVAPDTGGTLSPIRDSYPVDEIWTVNGLGESVSVANSTRMADGVSPWSAPDLLLTGSVPNRIVFFSNTGYIVNSYGNSLTLFDPETMRVTATIPLGSGHNPWDIAFRVTPGGALYALVSCFVSDRMLVVDLDAAAVVREIPLEPPGGIRARPEAITVMGGSAYVGCTGWDFSLNTFRRGYLARIDVGAEDPAAWSVSGYTATATNPQALLAVTVSDEIHILCSGINGQDDGMIAVYDAIGEAVTTNIPCGGSPNRFIPAGNGTVFLAGGRGILVYDSAGLALLRGSDNPLYDGGPDAYLPAAAWDGANHRLFVADFRSDRLLLIATNTGEILRESLIGDGPVDLAWRRQL